MVTSPTEIYVVKNITQVSVNTAANTTLISGATPVLASPTKESSKKEKAKLKPMASANTTGDNNVAVKATESQYCSQLKKRSKPKLKPLTSARKTEDNNSGAKATESQSASSLKKNRKPKLKPLTSARKQEDVTTSKKAPVPAVKKGKPKRKPLHIAKAESNVPINSSTKTVGITRANQKDPEKEFTSKLKAAEQEMKNAFVEAADVKRKKQQQQMAQLRQTQKAPSKPKSSLFDNNPPVIVTKSAPSKSTNYVYDDDIDDSDWLRVLSEIRDEVKDDDDEDDSNAVDYTSLINDASY